MSLIWTNFVIIMFTSDLFLTFQGVKMIQVVFGEGHQDRTDRGASSSDPASLPSSLDFPSAS